MAEDDGYTVTELVIEMMPPSIIAMEPTTSQVLVIEQPPEVTVLAVAEQGPQGPPGPGGGGGGSDASYVYQQASPSPNWVINHNLGFRPDVSLLSIGGVEIEGEVVHVSTNVVNILFVLPVAGSARCH